MSGRIHVAPKEERTLDGVTFASKAEMNRFAELRMLERAGLIEGLELQPRFVLQPKTDALRELAYIADFRYRSRETNRVVVEDVKGMRTEVYKLKRKLFLAKYPDIDFREVEA
jgi:hypothetical protein